MFSALESRAKRAASPRKRKRALTYRAERVNHKVIAHCLDQRLERRVESLCARAARERGGKSISQERAHIPSCVRVLTRDHAPWLQQQPAHKTSRPRTPLGVRGWLGGRPLGKARPTQPSLPWRTRGPSVPHTANTHAQRLLDHQYEAEKAKAPRVSQRDTRSETEHAPG